MFNFPFSIDNLLYNNKTTFSEMQIQMITIIHGDTPITHIIKCTNSCVFDGRIIVNYEKNLNSKSKYSEL